MTWEEEEEEGTRVKAKGDLELKEEEEICETGKLVGPLARAMPTLVPHNRETWFSEAWEYFHLAPEKAGHHPNQYAICQLCGRQVSCGLGANVGTTTLWKHLKSIHKKKLEKSGHDHAEQHQDLRTQRSLPMGTEGNRARLLEQVGALALWASQREKEVLRREKAVDWQERAVERREAVEEVESAILEMK
ncbi:LOW QUALITY PROTEIN: zinc finger BED domain-containing protein 2 [Trichechus inunguis]